MVPGIKKFKVFGLKSLWKRSLCFMNLTHIPQGNRLGGSENPIAEYQCVTVTPQPPAVCHVVKLVPGLCILLASS